MLVTALESGATREGVLEALRTTSPPAHRLERVATVSQVAYYDDSKATTPAAVATAMKAFPAVVLILGGKNKGLDLSVIKAATRESGSAILRGVVAIGESAAEIERTFSPDYPVRRAESMVDAVAAGASLAHPDDAVLLSPGCASFDWYVSYEARGDDFKDAVRRLAEESAQQ